MSAKIKLHQGDIIGGQEYLHKLGVDDHNLVAVVISHDCDIANTEEEYIEIITGTIIAEPNNLYLYARNPRCLHIGVSNADSSHVKIQQKNKKIIPRDLFAGIQPAHAIGNDHKRILKEWLVTRYARPEFPDSFESRLRKNVGSKTVIQQIKAIMKEHSAYVEDIYFGLGEHRYEELSEGEPYYLSIYVVYHSEHSKTARNNADKIVTKLKSLFNKAYGSEEDVHEIALDKCTAIPDSRFTLYDMHRVSRWNLGYISHKEKAAKQ